MLPFVVYITFAPISDPFLLMKASVTPKHMHNMRRLDQICQAKG